MKKMVIKLFVALLLVSPLASPGYAAMEIKETMMLSGFLGDNYKFNKQILRHAMEMEAEAKPFHSLKHRAKYRFEPKHDHPRTIMTLARKMSGRIKLVNGLLYHSDLPNRHLLVEQVLDSIASMVTYGKRGIRAINDNNYALYLAAAQGIEKEVFTMNELINSFENAINANIVESDDVRESL